MRRRTETPRAGWEHEVERWGLVYHHTRHPDGLEKPYWDESAYYAFGMDEVLELERTAEELHGMCVAAARHAVGTGRLADFHIPRPAWPHVERSLAAEPPTVYGRFDLSYDGAGPAKLLEYNADTPTALVESAIVQWYWLRDRHPDHDQWNSLHERLVEAWRAVAPAVPDGLLHVAHSSADTSGEDLMTAAYLRETADQAGLTTVALRMEDVGWNGRRRTFTDPRERPIRAIFKLYPWEWLLSERFAGPLLDTVDSTLWIEPIWKMLLSNKALLALLWELYPGHPNLLPAYLDGPRELVEYARKPLLGREGANVLLVREAGDLQTAGAYGAEGYVWQGYAPPPRTDGGFPVLGAWIVQGESAGLGIRESDGPVTDNFSRFVPHLIEEAP